MNFLLDSNPSNLGETLALGGEVVLVGMLSIFAVLGLIWACLLIFKIVFYDMKQGGGKVLVESKKSEAEVVVPVSRPTEDTEIIAVLAAAIAAAESDCAGLKFRVVSYRRK